MYHRLRLCVDIAGCVGVRLTTARKVLQTNDQRLFDLRKSDEVLLTIKNSTSRCAFHAGVFLTPGLLIAASEVVIGYAHDRKTWPQDLRAESVWRQSAG